MWSTTNPTVPHVCSGVNLRVHRSHGGLFFVFFDLKINLIWTSYKKSVSLISRYNFNLRLVPSFHRRRAQFPPPFFAMHRRSPSKMEEEDASALCICFFTMHRRIQPLRRRVLGCGEDVQPEGFTPLYCTGPILRSAPAVQSATDEGWDLRR